MEVGIWNEKREGNAGSDHRLDRSGKLISDWLEESTGSAALDAETIAIVGRAEPFPKPPASVPDAKLKMTVVLVFVPASTDDAKVNAKVGGICRGC